jgi:hypothetical protein
MLVSLSFHDPGGVRLAGNQDGAVTLTTQVRVVS